MTLITGPAGFIGSAVARLVIEKEGSAILFDKLTYAGHMGNIEELIDPEKGVHFIEGDICDYKACLKALREHNVTRVMNLAAESHVDNSINGPKPFMETNLMGTFALLEAARTHWKELPDSEQEGFRFLHVSTDEVFGSLDDGGYFTEETPYDPHSPYSASKAGSDHLVRAWGDTYGLPTVITNCSNNYGPRQFPEKLIPRMIDCALQGEKLPVYGKGENVRDWIHVEDHARGLYLAMTEGLPGETYCFGGRSERKNIDVVKGICEILDELRPREKGKYEELIEFVEDRAGHDWRYAIDDTKAERQLGFVREFEDFEDGLRQTVQWYLDNEDWVKTVKAKKS